MAIEKNVVFKGITTTGLVRRGYICRPVKSPGEYLEQPNNHIPIKGKAVEIMDNLWHQTFAPQGRSIFRR